MTAAAPAVSIVVASYNARTTIERCLRSLEAQTDRDFEVIVADSSTDGTGELVRRLFPEVRLVHFGERKFPGDARNAGILQARAPILAFLDSDTIADPDWVRSIAAAQASYPVAGGAVTNANPESAVACASYFCEFSAWMPAGERRVMRDIPTCCLSIRKEIFARFGPFLSGTYCSDTEMNWKLAAAGYPPMFIPAMRVAHVHLTSLQRFLRKQVMHGRAFARVRVQSERFSAARAALFAVGAAALPVLLFGRVASRVWRHRAALGDFLRSSPLVIAGLTCWALGESLGYAGHMRRPEAW